MKRVILSFLLSLMMPFLTMGQSATINNLRTEHGQYVGDVLIMKVLCDVYLNGMNGRTCHARMYVEHPQGTPWLDINGEYRSQNGTVSSGFSFVPDCDNCSYTSGFNIWIPLAEVHLTPDKRQYFVKVVIYGDSYENPSAILGQSDYVDFYGWGGSNDVYNNQTPNNDGGAAIVIPYQPTQHQERCGVCGGAGTCWNCHGSGISPNVTGIKAKCGACNGAGRCTNCSGMGYKILTY